MTSSRSDFSKKAHYHADVELLGHELIRCLNKNKAILVNRNATVTEIRKGHEGVFSPIFALLREYAQLKSVPEEAIQSLFRDALVSMKSYRDAIDGYGIYSPTDINDCSDAFAAAYVSPQLTNAESTSIKPLFSNVPSPKEDLLARLTKNHMLLQVAKVRLNETNLMFQAHLEKEKSVYTNALIVGLGDTGIELWRTVYKDQHDTALTNFKDKQEIDVLAVGRDGGSWGKNGVSYLAAQNAQLLHRVGDSNPQDFTLEQAEHMRVDANNIRKANDMIGAMRGMPRMQGDVTALEIREEGSIWPGEGLDERAQQAKYKTVIVFENSKGEEIKTTVYTDHLDICTGLGQKAKNIAETMILNQEQQALALAKNERGFTPCISGTEVVLENKDVGVEPNRKIIIYGYGGTAMAAMRKCVWGVKDKQPDNDDNPADPTKQKLTQPIVGNNVFFMCRSGTKGEGTLSSGVEKHMQWMEDNGRIIIAAVTNVEITPEGKVKLHIDKYDLIPNGVSVLQGRDFKAEHDALNKKPGRAELSEREKSFLTEDQIKSLGLPELKAEKTHYALKDINRKLQIVVVTESDTECDQLITALGDDPAEFEKIIMKPIKKETVEFITVKDEIENKPQVVGIQSENIRFFGAAAYLASKAGKNMPSSAFTSPDRPQNASITGTMPVARAGIRLLGALQHEASDVNINTAHIEEIRRALVAVVAEKDKRFNSRDAQITNFCTFVRNGRGQTAIGLGIEEINQALKDNNLDDCVQLDYNSTSILFPNPELLAQVQPIEPPKPEGSGQMFTKQ